jgi:ribosome-associated toxin RatA of RatAB toxin-antitoxin module
MKTVHKSVLIWHSAPQMFALVADVARYPEFLPWCSSGQVLEQTPQGMVASIGMSLGGIKKSFTTRNLHVPNQRIQLALVDGPFSHLEGTWDFTPVGQSDMSACKVEFTLYYGFSSQTLAALVGPVFDKIAGSLVDAFVKRADQVYGA